VHERDDSDDGTEQRERRAHRAQLLRAESLAAQTLRSSVRSNAVASSGAALARSSAEMRRELNEIEYLNWCVEQPYNMVVAVRVRGAVTPLELRSALDRAQRRHPLLGVNTEIGANRLPFFVSEGVGAIPLAVVESAEPEAARRLFDSELSARFERDGREQPRLPLIRVTLLVPKAADTAVDLVFTVQHVIGDGLSLAYLVRDLLTFIEQPQGPIAVLDAPASAEDLLPPKVRRRLPRSAHFFNAVSWLAKAYSRLRASGAMSSVPSVQCHRVWTLSVEQTARLRARCRQERVSLHAAVAAAFFSEFSWIHVPVNLRPFLARPVAESFGLFVGAAELRLAYQRQLGFWSNARRCQRRLQKALRDPFAVFRLFSKAVPFERVRELGPLLVKLAGKDRAFAITNLGDLDERGLAFHGTRVSLESFYGAVSGIVKSNVLTVYTLGGAMSLYLLANESSTADCAIRDAAGRAVQLLLTALDSREN
jgi:hypothetical protein